MNIKSCEKKEKSNYEIIIEISPEEFESEVSKAFLKNKNKIAVPGFRRGKASRKMVEGMYGAKVFHPDALENLIPEVIKFADEQTDLNKIGLADKAVTAALVGVFAIGRAGKTFECRSCGYSW